MSMPDPLTSEAAQQLLARAQPLVADEMVQLLRYLKRSNDDLVGKLRQMKSEIGRMAKH